MDIKTAVLHHVEALFPKFFESFINALLKTDVKDFFDSATDRPKKSDFLMNCKRTCEVNAQLQKAKLETLKREITQPNQNLKEEVKKANTDWRRWTEAIRTLDCVKDYYLSDQPFRFDSKLGLMVLIWEISGETVPRNLEIDMRGDATVETAVLSASHDIAPPTSSEIPRDLEVSDGKSDGDMLADVDNGGGFEPAKRITVRMGECKMSRRNRAAAATQLTLRLKLVRHFLLVVGLAVAGRDQFVLHGKVFHPAGTDSPRIAVESVVNHEIRIEHVMSSVRSFAVDDDKSDSSGEDDDSWA